LIVGTHEEKYAISHESFALQALVKNISCEKYASYNALEHSRYFQRLICHVQKDMDEVSLVLAMSTLYFMY
jgi:hypothetical protein